MLDPNGRELLTTKTTMRLAMEAAIQEAARTRQPAELEPLSNLFAGTSAKAGLKRRPSWTVTRRVPRKAGRGR